MDTSGFNELNVIGGGERGYITIELFRQNGTENIRLDNTNMLDSLYQYASIGGRNYNSVCFLSLKESPAHCKNIYYSYQYGLLSIEVNNHLIYLSEIKPVR